MFYLAPYNGDIVLVGRSDAEWDGNAQRINVSEMLNENDLSNSKIILNDNNSLQNKCLDNNNSKNVVKNENKKK